MKDHLPGYGDLLLDRQLFSGVVCSVAFPVVPSTCFKSEVFFIMNQILQMQSLVMSSVHCWASLKIQNRTDSSGISRFVLDSKVLVRRTNI